MPTSGSSDFNLTAQALVTRAYKICKGVTGQALTTAQIDDGREKLNLILKDWQNKGVSLWRLDESWQQFQASTFILGTDGLTYECLLSHTSDSTNRPITGANWGKFWVRLGSGGAAWVSDQSYVSAGDYSLADDVIGLWVARLRDANGTDHPITILTEMDLKKANYNFAIDRATFPVFISRTTGLSSNRLLVRPLPQDTTVGVLFTTVKRLQDFDTSGNDPDAPARWLRTIVYALAGDLSDDLHLPLEERLYLKGKADELFRDARSASGMLDQEEDSGIEPYLVL